MNYAATVSANELLFAVYNASAGDWVSQFIDTNQPGNNVPRYHSFTATVMGTLAHVAYTTQIGDDAWGDVWYLSLGLSNSFGPGVGDHTPIARNSANQAEIAPLYPSITWGPPGNVYVFWRARDDRDANQDWAVRNVTLYGPFPLPTWSDVSTQFGITTGQYPTWITTPKAVFNRVPAVWRDSRGSCVQCDLVYGSIPLIDDFSGSSAHPWARGGLGRHASMIAELTDFVNPANGQLLVGQVDAGVPGRGLDLVLSRIHINPYAFQGSQPIHYETNPAVPMGLGWQINLPWKSGTHLHLPDGQRYLLSWSDGKAVNRHGTPFTLYFRGSYPAYFFDLYLVDGTRANFTAAGRLQFIEDTSGNRISFNYDPSARLTSIVDTMGRTATFLYHVGGVADRQVSTISFGGRTVTFQYATGANGSVVLQTVTYPLGRTTSYAYTGIDDYLIKTVTQPWGASTTYAYGSAPVGTEATAYLVTDQTVKDGTTTVRTRAYDYTLANGWSLATKVTVGDGTFAKGYQVLSFASTTRGMTTVLKDISGQPMGKTVQWYDEDGRVGQIDVYLGRAQNVNYSSLVALDNWSNPYYARTPLSPGFYHETFASYANTDSADAFRSPGVVGLQADGKVLHENFEQHDLATWTLTTSGGATIGLDKTVWDRAPPSMRLTQAASGNALAKRFFAPQSGSFLFGTSLRAAETSKSHSIILGQGAASRIELSFDWDGWVRWRLPGGVSDPLQTYEANRWYGIWLEVDMGAGSATIVIDGKSYTRNVYQIGTVEWVAYGLQAGATNMWVGSLSLSKPGPGGTNRYRSFRLTNLAAGQAVEYYDTLGALLWT
ncbi:MAG: hypothetical protein ACREDF_01690, partial [Thermoplasmata archaeon]